MSARLSCGQSFTPAAARVRADDNDEEEEEAAAAVIVAAQHIHPVSEEAEMCMISQKANCCCSAKSMSDALAGNMK